MDRKGGESMEHIRPLIIKYIYIAAITIIFLTYLMAPSVAPGSSLVIAIFVTLVLYFAGDRFLLPRFGALTTAIASFELASVILSLANGFVREPITVGSLLAPAAVIGVVEWFYFRYAQPEVTPAFEGGQAGAFPDISGGEEQQAPSGEGQGGQTQGDQEGQEGEHDQ